jgi:hypothetical protein
MKSLTRKITLAALSFSSLFAITGCTDPNGGVRYEHEPAKMWTESQTPEDDDVKAQAFTAFDLNGAYSLIKNNSKTDLTASVLVPLSEIVLNAKFIENPIYRTSRLSQMISIFNTALAIEFGKSPRSAKFETVKNAYYETVFAGCSRDLRVDCINAALFSADSRHTQIMGLLARELDPQIEAELKAAGSPALCINNANSDRCRNLVEERYRRLTMGMRKRSMYPDADFSFAYLKYARLFALYLDWAKARPAAGDDHASMSASYVADVHGQIFETILAKYTPANMADKDFRAFVENFNPWGYSHKSASLFQYGTSVMFDLATKCCLYQDSAKKALSLSVTQSIAESQKDRDAFGPSFVQMIDEIRKEHQDRLFRNLGLLPLVQKIDVSRRAFNDPTKPFPAGNFFNEYFFMVDRLFRGHLSSAEIEMVLQNSNAARSRVELPAMISNYVKVYLAYMVLETNHFMAGIYQSDIASDKIFEEALVRSREITSRWYTIQAQADLLNKLMNSYFKNLQITTSDYENTDRMLKAVNRNIHYIAAFPNMIVMNYFLAKMKGSITINTWFGQVQINADTVLKDFFDGHISEPWFRFGKDPESLDRVMLLYSLEYMLSTEGLKAFVAKDDTSAAGNERSKFFDLIFTKYIGDTVDTMRKAVTDYQRATAGNPTFATAKSVCAYEAKGGGLAPHLTVNFLDLHNYTYSGLGNNSINKVLVAFLTAGTGNTTAATAGAITSTDTPTVLLTQIESRKTYVKVMLDVIEGDLLRTGMIKRKGDPHPDLDKARSILKELDGLQAQFIQLFVGIHKAYFSCALKLREIERRRANRLYDEERAHLGMIYDLMKKELAGITDAKALDAKVAQVNASFFRKNGAYTFDRIDGMNYRMSKYDLLMRIKQRVESDVFSQPTAKEATNYGGTLQTYLKPRSVTVYVPEGIVRDPMYADGTSTSILFKGTTEADREDFINQGLNMFNGTNEAYVHWQGQMQNDQTFLNYLKTLETVYLLQPVPGQGAVTAADLASAYLSFTSSVAMDDYDMEYARIFGAYGRYPKEFFQGRWFEKDGMTRLPLFYNLMNDVYKMASLTLDSAGGVVNEGLLFAKQFNSLQAFVFAPALTQGGQQQAVAASVADHYGERIHYRLNRVGELYSYLQQQEQRVQDAAALSPSLARPFYLEGNTYYTWYQAGSKNLVDAQRARDHRILIGDFTQRSGDFYGTREKVRAP